MNTIEKNPHEISNKIINQESPYCTDMCFVDGIKPI